MNEYEKMAKEDKERIQQFIDKSVMNDDCIGFIGITNNGIGVHGDTMVVTTLFTMLAKHLYSDAKIPENVLRRAFDLAFMSEKELEKELLESIKTRIEDLENEIK